MGQGIFTCITNVENLKFSGNVIEVMMEVHSDVIFVNRRPDEVHGFGIFEFVSVSFHGVLKVINVVNIPSVIFLTFHSASSNSTKIINSNLIISP